MEGFDRISSHGEEAGAVRRLIHGDNLEVLRALKASMTGMIRCAYFDPPYNTNEKWVHYKDSQDSGDWLTQIRMRARAVKPLLTEDGSLWVSIDEGEVHYLKCALDEVFGRKNFVTSIIWQKRINRENRSTFSNDHEYLLVYARDPKAFRASRNLLTPTDDLLSRYKNPDNDPRGPWQPISLSVQHLHGRESQMYTYTAPNGKTHTPGPGRCWRFTEPRMKELVEDGRIWFGHDGNNVPHSKMFLSEVENLGLNPRTIWFADEVGTSSSAKKKVISLFPDQRNPFDTPKPEELIDRVLHIATNPGDIVLDAYLGSGTTTAVAHRKGRGYIGIENSSSTLELAKHRLDLEVEADGGGYSCWEMQGKDTSLDDTTGLLDL